MRFWVLPKGMNLGFTDVNDLRHFCRQKRFGKRTQRQAACVSSAMNKGLTNSGKNGDKWQVGTQGLGEQREVQVMASNTNQAAGRAVSGGSGQRPEEKTLKTAQLHIERKMFYFALKENSRGRFLRITEDVNGRRDHIIVPAPGLHDFAKVVEHLAREADALNASQDSTTPSNE